MNIIHIDIHLFYNGMKIINAKVFRCYLRRSTRKAQCAVCGSINQHSLAFRWVGYHQSTLIFHLRDKVAQTETKRNTQ